MTYKRLNGEREQPSEALGPSAFMQQLLLKRRLRRLTADSGKLRAPIEWQDKYSSRTIPQEATVK